MEKKLFDKFRNLIYTKSGISLNDSKEALVNARIQKRMKALEIHTDGDYYTYIINDKTETELVYLLDAITTNVTHFFREPHHFELMKQLLHEWLQNGESRLRIWSAGCSSGEEPYSIVMTIMESININRVDCKILATDLSTKILSQSINGAYSEDKLENMHSRLKEKYFTSVISYKGFGEYQIKDTVKKYINFHRLNLSQTPYIMKGPFDIIFCRNVMIYFDNDIRKTILSEYYRLLKNGGYLFVGHAESLTGMLCGFTSVQPSVYKKNT